MAKHSNLRLCCNFWQYPFLCVRFMHEKHIHTFSSLTIIIQIRLYNIFVLHRWIRATPYTMHQIKYSILNNGNNMMRQTPFNIWALNINISVEYRLACPSHASLIPFICFYILSSYGNTSKPSAFYWQRTSYILRTNGTKIALIFVVVVGVVVVFSCMALSRQFISLLSNIDFASHETEIKNT